MVKMKKIVYFLLPICIAFFGFQTNKISQIKQEYLFNSQHRQKVILELKKTNSILREEIENLIRSYLNLTEGKESHQLCKMIIDVPLLEKSPRIIKKVMPDEDWLIYARLEGLVLLEVLIDSEGNKLFQRII